MSRAVWNDLARRLVPVAKQCPLAGNSMNISPSQAGETPARYKSRIKGLIAKSRPENDEGCFQEGTDRLTAQHHPHF